MTAISHPYGLLPKFVLKTSLIDEVPVPASVALVVNIP